MEIIQFLNSVDHQWLLALNNDYATFWDNVMLLVSAKTTWIPFYIAILMVVIKNWGKNSWLIIVGLILCIIIADQTASGLLKNIVQRPRPFLDPSIQNMVVLVDNYKAGGYSFVSSHAANAFGLATLTSLLLRNRIFTFSVLVWATIIAYSRVYLGVHFPGDIVGGAIVGSVAAYIVYFILKKIKSNLLTENLSNFKFIYLPLWIILSTFVIFLIYSAIITLS